MKLKNIAHIAPLLLTAAMLFSCSTSRKVQGTGSATAGKAETKAAAAYATKVTDNAATATCLSARASYALQAGSKDISLGGTLRMKKDDVIRLSMTFLGMEVVRMEFTPDKVLAQKREAMEEKDPNLKYLIREYHDGLLLYEVSNREVWAKAANDEPGLKDFFRKNRKQYKWDAPRFKGVAYSAHKAEDVEAVKKALRGVPFEKWADVLRTTFNNDSVLRIHAEKGIFKEGDNALVDKEVFGKDTVVRAEKDYPYSAIYGKKLKKPEDYDDVRAQVVADYQDALEKQWVAGLRKKYAVTVDKAVLATVNKH